ncbi:MAG: hypothetical protein ACJAT5_000435 [Lentimonas sp.]|jgi:hypothetical protein
MGGDISIPDKFNFEDIKNLRKFGIIVKVILDLSHTLNEKPVHLDIELDFNTSDLESFNALISNVKQRQTSTYVKLWIKKLKPKKKSYTGKIEVKSFSNSIIKNAGNKSDLQKALKEHKASGKELGMLEVKI